MNKNLLYFSFFFLFFIFNIIISYITFSRSKIIFRRKRNEDNLYFLIIFNFNPISLNNGKAVDNARNVSIEDRTNSIPPIKRNSRFDRIVLRIDPCRPTTLLSLMELLRYTRMGLAGAKTKLAPPSSTSAFHLVPSVA